MSKASAVDVLYQDIVHLEKTMSDLGAQVVRLQRLVNIDKEEAAIGEQQSRTELVRAINNQTALISELLSRKSEVDVEGELYYQYHQNRKERRNGASKRLKYLRYLERCKQVTTPKCSCGEHKGIRFLDKTGNIVEELCPKAWWVSLTRIAFEEGNLVQFVKSTPQDIFIRPYILRINP